MRRSLLILLAVELLLALALGQMARVDSPAMARAWWEWHQHPTPETRQAFERQRRITEYERWGFSGVVFAVLAGATILVFWMRKGEQDDPANGSQPIRSETNPTSPAAGSRR
jgi:hypothetical protein